MRGHRAKESVQKPKPKPKSGGLDVELHPFLKNIGPGSSHGPTGPGNGPTGPGNRPGPRPRPGFDSLSYNPYLDQGVGKRRTRALQFNTPGKYIAQGEKLRRELNEEHEKRQYEMELERRGLVADRGIGEDLYAAGPRAGTASTGASTSTTDSTSANNTGCTGTSTSASASTGATVEWWDSYYLPSYAQAPITDNPLSPITKYIQHPPLSPASGPGAGPASDSSQLFLTKKELKRKRKNERQEKLRVQQERIRAGLDPPPPPKVKLSNLMSVLTNEAIKDPTLVENRVKKEVELRHQAHLAANESRKLTPQQRHQKQHAKTVSDRAGGCFRAVYKVRQLVDSQHFFKVDKNAQQLELCGLCVVGPQMALVVVEGGAKAVRFYDKLMMRRVDWTKSCDGATDLTHNGVVKVWEGQVEGRFRKWSVIKTGEVESVLERFGLVSEWRMALQS